MTRAGRARRIGEVWGALAPTERRRTLGMFAVIATVNLLGWGIFVIEILPGRFQYGGLGAGIGVAVTAWTLGARHGFDADHIAAIDNCTRKLMADGRRPLGTGFFFASGHSSVVMVVGVGITIAAKSVYRALVTPSSGFETAGGIAGTAMSATFLWIIAALNLVVLAGIAGVFREMRRAVFGIGFDTATEVLLLAGTAAAATQGLPWFAVLTLPLLFSGGLMLCDSIDGFLMNFAYGWAFARPVRKVYYNITITALSVGVAFLVGGIEIVGLLSTELRLHGLLGDLMASFDLNTAGYLVVGLFIIIWSAALGIWRFGRIEARWEAAAARSAAERANG